MIHALLLALGLAHQPVMRTAQVETCQWPHRCEIPKA